MKIKHAARRYFTNGARQAHARKRQKERKGGEGCEKISRKRKLVYGKTIAKSVATLFGYKDCGCDKRQEKLNKYIFTKDGIKKL